MIRVVHVSPTDLQGGACLGAYNLHKAIQARGVDSRMLVLRKFSDDPSVVPRNEGMLAKLDALRDPMDRLPLRSYRWDSSNWWSVGWLPFDLRRAINRLKPDVVQFHWAGRGAVPIKALSRLSRYPLIWSLRDMWPLTGGCHYAGDCNKFTSGCGSCPQLGSSSDHDLSRWQWRKKRRYWSGVPITYVALSNWMASCARRSPLVHGNDIVTIPNGVDVGHFRPFEKAQARAAWGLPLDKQIVLFGALHAVRDPRKGFQYLADAMRRLSGEGWAEKAIAVVFGAADGDLDLGMPISYVGHVRNGDLPRLYASADVMVVPSVFENSAKTAIEALACGIPVVAFANTGQVDIVDHKVKGYLAADRSVADLARGIAWCLKEVSVGSELATQARAKALNSFDIDDVARIHVELYRKLVAERRLLAERAGAASWSGAIAQDVFASLHDDQIMGASDRGAG